MQRHGWAFCFVLLLTGLAAAQPPADLERYPPAPTLPGSVVGQSFPAKAAGKPLPAGPTVVSTQSNEPAPTPRALDGEPFPTGPSITATTQPVEAPPAAPPSPTNDTKCKGNAKSCKSGGCSSSCLQRVIDWCTFHSNARQHGCYPSPYRPPLQAWFPCNPNGAPCARCGSGNMGALTPGPVISAPEAPLPTPNPAMPGAPGDPGGATRKAPAVSAEPVVDGLPGAIRVDTGLLFSPGGAPMAKPTTQLEKVSTWRPK